MTYQLQYTDSIGQTYQLTYQANSYLNLMEFIRDKSYEDWGDCRGRAWCASCHIAIISKISLIPADTEEISRLGLMTNLKNNSRLACQIPLNQKLQNAQIIFIGED